MSDNKKKFISRKDALKALGGLALFPVASSIPIKAASNEERIHPKSSSSHKLKKKKAPTYFLL